MRQIIAVVEDEKGIADTITYALKTEGFDAIHVSTGAEATQLINDQNISLLILDVGLPDTDGFALAKEIRKTSNVPIIYLTARNSEIDRVLGLELGADDYMTKPFSPRELTARVKAVLRRTANGNDSNTSQASTIFEIDDKRFQIKFKGSALELSPHEFRLLKVLIKSPGRVYTREHLMSLCWDEPGMSLERTVDAHIKNLRAKFKILSKDEVIITHRGIGYSLSESI